MALVDNGGVVLSLAHFDKLDCIGHFLRNLVDRPNRGLEPAAFAHHRFGALRIVPQLRILDPRVQLVEPAQRAIPVKELAHQRQCLVDPIDMGLPLGTHASLLQLLERPRVSPIGHKAKEACGGAATHLKGTRNASA